MITIQFQALSNYQKKDSDQREITQLFKEVQETFPTLFEEEDVVVDVRVDQDPNTLFKEVTVVSVIPKHSKLVAESTAKTFSQAVSNIKTDVYRYCRQELGT